MDERLDSLERALLEMTRELKSGTASLTGGVTTISTGGYAGAGVSTGIVPPHHEQADQQHGDHAKDGKKEGSHPTQAADKASRDGEEGRVVEVEAAGPPRPSGIPIREVIASGAIGHADGTAESRAEVMEEGIKAAERARKAREVVDAAEQQQAHQQQQAAQHADGNPLQTFADGARRAVGGWSDCCEGDAPLVLHHLLSNSLAELHACLAEHMRGLHDLVSHCE
jgi:hypothetical protein